MRALSDKTLGDSQTYAIIGAAMEVHRTLGPGFLEPVYQSAFAIELDLNGVPYDREVELPLSYKGKAIGVRYRVDFVCHGNVLVELKALDRLTSKEDSQIIHYLVSSYLGRGLLLNFGAQSLQFKRFLGPTAGVPYSSVKSVQSVDCQ